MSANLKQSFHNIHDLLSSLIQQNAKHAEDTIKEELKKRNLLFFELAYDDDQFKAHFQTIESRKKLKSKIEKTLRFVCKLDSTILSDENKKIWLNAFKTLQKKYDYYLIESRNCNSRSDYSKQKRIYIIKK